MMKFKTIIAAVMALSLAAGTFGMTMTASASVTNEQAYSADSDSNATISIYDTSGNRIYSANAGDTILIVATPKPGHRVTKITVTYDGYTVTQENSNTWTFTMPSSSVISISATTEPIASVSTPTPDTTTTNLLCGDVNLDGKVNAADATLVLKHAVELIKLAGQGYMNADVNGDGYINAKDATEILKISVGLA